MERAALRALEQAVGLARAGDLQRARELCAAVVFDMQPLLARRPALLRAVLHAALVARGFTFVSRLVLAISGRSVRVVPATGDVGAIALPRSRAGAGGTVYEVDTRWVERVAADDTSMRQWCDAIMARPAGRAEGPGLALASRDLETV